MENICIKCINSDFLKKILMEKCNRGRCSYCNANNILCVSIKEVTPYFHNLINAYDQVDQYDPISIREHIGDLIQADWEIFADRITNKGKLHEVVTDILYVGIDLTDDHPDFNGDWKRTESSLEEDWDEISRRFLEQGEKISFSDNHPSIINPFEIALEDLAFTLKKGTVLYRGRLHKDRNRHEPFEELEMLAPPKEKAKSGRFNKNGEIVLYASSDEETALSEVRPWVAVSVAIADLYTNRETNIVDLVDNKISLDPFADELIRWKVQLSALFNRLSYEFSIPVQPEKENNMYLIGQEVAQEINRKGYDGIKYKSSVSTGSNIAFFHTDIAEISGIYYKKVMSVFYSTVDTETEPYYEPLPYDDIV